MKLLKKVSLLLSFAVLATTCAFAVNIDKKADAAGLLKGTATGYAKASDVEYEKTGKYVHNWGARDEECTFLTSYATSFYTGSYTFDNLSQKSGGSSQSNAYQSDLYDALQDMMSAKHSYETSYKATRDLFCYTDCVNNNSSNISSFYSASKISGTWDGGDTWNREHTWPNSKGLGGNDENDIMMLRPTSVNENSSRSNTAYGESGSYYDPNGEGQNLRGDCARIVLYVYVRWGNTNYMWGTSGVMENLTVLLDWMEEDPVDTWEMGRNDAVQSITGTRNVFVDYPEYAWLLFGRDIPNDICTPSGIAAGGEYVPTPDDSSSSSSSESSSSTPDDEMTQADVVDEAYTLTAGETLGEYTLTGVISKVDSYTNPTIIVAGKTDKPIYCYRLKSDEFEVGDTITVKGNIINYDGIIEMEWCSLLDHIKGGEETPDDSSSYIPDDDSSSSYVPDDDSSSYIPDDTTSSSYAPDDDSSSYIPDDASSSSYAPDDDSSSEILDDSSSLGSDSSGHNFSNWIVIKQPTENEDGKQMRTCYDCGATETQILPKLSSDEPVDGGSDGAESSQNDRSAGVAGGCQSAIGGSLSAVLLTLGACLVLKKSKKE